MKITKKLIKKIMEGEYRGFEEKYEVTDPEEIVKNFLSTKAYTKAGMDDSQRAEFARGLVNIKEFTQYIIDGEVFHEFEGRMFNSNDEEVDPNDPTEVTQQYPQSGPAPGTLTTTNPDGSRTTRSTGGYVSEGNKMKITKKELNDIIKEEANKLFNENRGYDIPSLIRMADRHFGKGFGWPDSKKEVERRYVEGEDLGGLQKALITMLRHAGVRI